MWHPARGSLLLAWRDHLGFVTSGRSLKVLGLSSLIYQIGVITTLTLKWVVSVSEFRCMTGEPLTEPSMGTSTARSTLHKRIRKPEREAERLKSHSTPYRAQVEGSLPQRQVSLVQAGARLGPFMAEHPPGRTGTASPPAESSSKLLGRHPQVCFLNPVG